MEDEELKNTAYERCSHSERTEDFHSCPFDEEVNDDHSKKCKCCLDCQGDCCADI